VHILQLKDGSLLVTDENNGAIYRITHEGKAKTARL
jgi:glucose/arabinose dehydrogenase